MNRPFDAKRYKRLLEGLETTVVSYSSVLAAASTCRFDPEYFAKQHLADATIAASHDGEFVTFATLGLKVEGSAFYPAIEEFYGAGDLPFIRVADVDVVIDFEQCARIPAALCDRFPTLRRVHPGDIVFTKGGSVARVGLVTEEAAASRDLIFIDTSKLEVQDQRFLSTYFQTDYFNRMLVRSSSQTAQPHLTITLVRPLPIYEASDELKTACSQAIEQAYVARQTAINRMRQVDTTLAAALDLVDWQPPQPLSYTRRASRAFAAGRLDAEYFEPEYAALRKHVCSMGGSRLGDVVTEKIRRGISPVYVEDGDLPVINSQHVGKERISFEGTRTTLKSLVAEDKSARTGRVGQWDVLLNSTGRITIGRCQCVLDDINAVVDNHVSIIRPKSGLDPVYLASFLNSRFGLMLTEQSHTGSSGQIEMRPELIEDFEVWMAPVDVQTSIRKSVLEANANGRRARELLSAAQRAVELAIEQDEAAALAYLDGFDVAP